MIWYSGVGIILAISVVLIVGAKNIHKTPSVSVRGDLPTFTRDALKQFDGTNESLPIYVALDGYIYDVTAGASFYKPGGTYHSIAGIDATRELHIFGGAIIKEKYPIVGSLIL